MSHIEIVIHFIVPFGLKDMKLFHLKFGIILVEMIKAKIFILISYTKIKSVIRNC